KGDKVCREALELANTHAEKVKVFLIQMARLQAEAKYSEAMDLAKETLQYIGIIVPAREEIPELLHVYLDKIDSFLSNREVMSMMDFPNNEDELYHVTMQTFSYLLIASYLGSQIELIPWTITSMVLLCIENGNNEISPLAYVQYGFLMCSIYKDYTRGYEFGKLSIILSNQYQNRQIRGSVYYYFASQIAHWFEPLKDILLYLDKAFKDNIQSGNLIYADYTGSQYLSFRMISGFPLDKLYEEQQRFLPFSSSFNPKGYEGGIRPGIVQPMLQLLSLSNNTYNFDSEMFSEERYLEEFKDYPVFLAWFYHAKLRSLYLFEEWEELKEILDTPEIVAMGLPGTPIIPEAYFYAALGICNLYYELEENKKEYYSSLLDFYLSEFAVWSSNSPRNYSCKYYLILAEKAKMENKIETALFYYDKAVAFSRESEMIHIEALCMELQAKLWAVRKKDDLVIFYMQKAVQLYMLWSAKRKVSQLQEKYPGYQWEQERKSGSNSENTTSVLKSFHSGPFIGSIDFSSVLDASRAIAGEIVFTELLHKLIEIVMQNSGAESAFLLVKKQGKLIVEDYNSLNRLISVPCRLEEFSHLPHTIIYYVERTFSTLVLSDACREPRFMNDRYIQEYQPHSILCTPLMDRGNLLGIIYLENRITKGAFTQERVQVLELISSQAAISLENSLLYSSLEEKVEERTKSLQKALNEVKALKEQQDGDYFLISILTEPLGPNLVKSDRVNIEFFLKQKKSFQFHGEEYEIGGDINIAHSIRLQGKNCVVFLNGDAMGKSSQGAGGVLVLGTAFGVIIDRTKSSKWGERLSPSQWIANAFVEMHRVFLSFRGLMSMSAFLGIIDEESGTLYYISAEHPPPILYRNKKASFMEVNKKLRKLGTIGIHELEVKDILTIEQQLEKGDIIVSASDGREDVLVEDENGEVFMNSDETVFLRLLEDSSANIKEVVEKLLYRGEITDDLSILKVEYK
ncbi:MAG: SpoIIE family protein phosphatase, partial [Leptospiraceae bacterium]|nr:SpoIIE family protein phosphatase [Leptospiraceae bacterium]